MMIRTTVNRSAACLAALLALAAFPSSSVGANEDAGGASLAGVQVFDGTAWFSLDLHDPVVEGPNGGDSPTARFKAELGGPKTFTLVAGPTSQRPVPVPRPRFRLSCDRSTANLLRFAPLEVVDGARRTPVEITKGVVIFRKGIEVEVTKVEARLWEIRPKRSLEPGEYILALPDLSPVADFTIVESGY